MNTALIIGGGINGLCTARALVLRGWQVTVVERGPLPNPLAASWDHHRLIRSQYAAQPHYAARMAEAYLAWDRLFADIAARPYAPRGVFALSRNEGDWTDRSRASFEAAHIAHEVLSPAQITTQLPMLEPEGIRYALLTRDGGALLSDRIIEALLHWLTARDVRLIPHCPVSRIDAATATAHTALGPMQADRLIVAAGIGLPALNPWFARHTHARRSTVVYADPPVQFRAAWATAPAWVDMGGEEDLWGIPPVGPLPLKLGYGLHTRPGDPERERETTEADTTEIIEAYRGRLRDLDSYIPRETIANFYLMAPDQDFVLRGDGPTLWLSADSGHGFKFGALTGEDTADAVCGDWRVVAQRMNGRPLPTAPATV